MMTTSAVAAAIPARTALSTPAAQGVPHQLDPRIRGQQPPDLRHGVVLVEVVDDQDALRQRDVPVDLLQRAADVGRLVVDGHDEVDLGRGHRRSSRARQPRRKPGTSKATSRSTTWSAPAARRSAAGRVVVDPHGEHAGGLRRLDADRGVLEDDRAPRVDAGLPRGDQEDLRVGLAVRDVLQRGDRGEPPVQAALARPSGRGSAGPRSSRSPAGTRRPSGRRAAPGPRPSGTIWPRGDVAVADLLQVAVAAHLVLRDPLAQQLAEDARVGHAEGLVDELRRQRQPGRAGPARARPAGGARANRPARRRDRRWRGRGRRVSARAAVLDPRASRAGREKSGPVYREDDGQGRVQYTSRAARASRRSPRIAPPSAAKMGPPRAPPRGRIGDRTPKDPGRTHEPARTRPGGIGTAADRSGTHRPARRGPRRRVRGPRGQGRDLAAGDRRGLRQGAQAARGRLRRRPGPAGPGDAVHRLADAPRASGTSPARARTWYAATGDEGKVFRREGKERAWTVAYDADDTQALALAVLPDGRVFVGTGPSGQVVEVTDPKHPASRPDPGVQYIWDLAADAGRQPLRRDRADRPALEAGGRRQVVARCSTASTPTCSASRSAPDGAVYAGSDGEGLIYRVGPDGKVSVVYDAPQSEIRTLLFAPDGALYAGTAAESAAGARAARPGSPPRADGGSDLAARRAPGGGAIGTADRRTGQAGRPSRRPAPSPPRLRAGPPSPGRRSPGENAVYRDRRRRRPARGLPGQGPDLRPGLAGGPPPGRHRARGAALRGPRPGPRVGPDRPARPRPDPRPAGRARAASVLIGAGDPGAVVRLESGLRRATGR